MTESSRAIVKQIGVTHAERVLGRLCERSFLSLWSYPGIYRDQRSGTTGHGKEVCDLLVVFGNDILIFSDKDCAFPNTGNLDQDWSRWFRRAVASGAQQLWGAERWIRTHPDRLFLDRACIERLPVTFDASTVRFHRIVVAHDVARRCAELLGGSGSLMLCSLLRGKAHYEGPSPFPDLHSSDGAWAKNLRKAAGWKGTLLPFTIGDVDPQRGFVHVFDDTSLPV